MVTSETTKKLMELAWEYKKGLRSLESAVIKGSHITGFTPEVTESFLKGLVRDNIVAVDFRKKKRLTEWANPSTNEESSPEDKK
jgi:hypothetical protein